MYNILKTADRRAKRVKFDTRGPGYCIGRVNFLSHSLSVVWGHSVHFWRNSDVKIF